MKGCLQCSHYKTIHTDWWCLVLRHPSNGVFPPSLSAAYDAIHINAIVAGNQQLPNLGQLSLWSGAIRPIWGKIPGTVVCSMYMSQSKTVKLILEDWPPSEDSSSQNSAKMSNRKRNIQLFGLYHTLSMLKEQFHCLCSLQRSEVQMSICVNIWNEMSMCEHLEWDRCEHSECEECMCDSTWLVNCCLPLGMPSHSLQQVNGCTDTHTMCISSLQRPPPPPVSFLANNCLYITQKRELSYEVLFTCMMWCNIFTAITAAPDPTCPSNIAKYVNGKGSFSCEQKRNGWYHFFNSHTFSRQLWTKELYCKLTKRNLNFTIIHCSVILLTTDCIHSLEAFGPEMSSFPVSCTFSPPAPGLCVWLVVLACFCTDPGLGTWRRTHNVSARAWSSFNLVFPALMTLWK